MSKLHKKELTWKYIDDGTGRNSYYLSSDGEKTRTEPVGFKPQLLENGDRFYYFRGKCVRCKKDTIADVMCKGNGEEAYSFNMCSQCIITTSGVTRMRGNGDIIYEMNSDVPKNMYVNVKKRALDPNKDSGMQKRSEDAKVDVLKSAKSRRDRARFLMIKEKARGYEIPSSGHYVSWGYGDRFDEYFGQVDEENLPNGLGIKFYSDGTIYFGPWANGYQKTDVKGTWLRPDGSQYEGTWLQGRKHGVGKQIYADETMYEGQFANGFEHGEGKKTYSDGSSFEGRFRFGRRDGPGVLTTANGQTQKGNFRDALMTNEKAPPAVFESDREILDPLVTLYNPQSLMSLCVDQIAHALIRRADIYPPSRIQRRASDHLKPILGEAYMRALGTISADYMAAGREIAFRLSEQISHDRVRMRLADMEAFLYLQGANSALKSLRLTTNKMESPAVESLGRMLPSRCWPNIKSLDLSFNSMDYRALVALTEGVSATHTITELKLASCKINHTTSPIFYTLISNDTHLTDIDLAFNILGSKGAEDIANALRKNKTLKSLNLRQNNLGPVGGGLLVDSLVVNKTIHTLCLADNKCGDKVITLLAGRLAGTVPQLMDSVKFAELGIPSNYIEHDAIPMPYPYCRTKFSPEIPSYDLDTTVMAPANEVGTYEDECFDEYESYKFQNIESAGEVRDDCYGIELDETFDEDHKLTTKGEHIK